MSRPNDQRMRTAEKIVLRKMNADLCEMIDFDAIFPSFFPDVLSYDDKDRIKQGFPIPKEQNQRFLEKIDGKFERSPVSPFECLVTALRNQGSHVMLVRDLLTMREEEFERLPTGETSSRDEVLSHEESSGGGEVPHLPGSKKAV